LGAVEERDGKLYATGSRAIAVLGVGSTITEAEKIAETEINKIRGKVFHRPDIGTENLIAKRIQQMQELRQ
jgi:fusion protein PurCD